MDLMARQTNMKSINRRILYGEAFNDVRCLSTDEKPVTDIKNGSVLTEIDTGKQYLFDADSSTWFEYSGGGGSAASISPIPDSTIHSITGV